MKIEELQSSLKAQELLVIDRSSERLVQQALQAQTTEKEGTVGTTLDNHISLWQFPVTKMWHVNLLIDPIS